MQRWTLGVLAGLCAASVVAGTVSRASAQNGFALTPSAFAEGTGQFLMDNAEAEIRNFAAQFFAERLCRDVTSVAGSPDDSPDGGGEYTGFRATAAALLPSTCTLIRAANNELTSAMGLGTFRSALREDLAGLGTSIVAKLVARQDASVRRARLIADRQAANAVLRQRIQVAEQAGNRAEADRLKGALQSIPETVPPVLDSATSWTLLATLDFLQAATSAAIRARDARAVLVWSTLQRGLDREKGTLCRSETAAFWNPALALLGAARSGCTPAQTQALTGSGASRGNASVTVAQLASARFGAVGAPPSDQDPERRLIEVQAAITQLETPQVAAPGPNLLQEQLADIDQELAEQSSALLLVANEQVGTSESTEHSQLLLNRALGFAVTAVERAICDGGSAEACTAVRESGDVFVRLAAALAERRLAEALQIVATAGPVRELVQYVIAGPSTGDHASESERQRWVERVFRLLQLCADMGSADSGSGVQAALDAFAEPLGSWRGKHEGGLTIFLQGYAGVYVGTEFLATETSDVGFAMGPSLSVGLQFSRAGSQGRDFRSFFYLQVLDVANVLSVRVDGDGGQVETVGDPTWIQLFAPGAYGGVSLGRSPFDLLAGIAYVPALRREADGMGGFEQVPAVRVTLGLAVDVSIMRLR